MGESAMIIQLICIKENRNMPIAHYTISDIQSMLNIRHRHLRWVRTTMMISFFLYFLNLLEGSGICEP
jgi:hypothetical protein